jgi:hypothetical protein
MELETSHFANKKKNKFSEKLMRLFAHFTSYKICFFNNSPSYLLQVFTASAVVCIVVSSPQSACHRGDYIELWVVRSNPTRVVALKIFYSAGVVIYDRGNGSNGKQSSSDFCCNVASPG